MWRFHRYYIKEFLLNLSLTFVMLFGVTLLALVARGIYRSQGVDLLIGLRITLMWTIDAIPHLLSISVLVASVFTFGRAAADNEITAMRMAGISPVRLIGAVLFVGALTAAANGWLVHNVIPHVHYVKYRPTDDELKLLLMNNKSRQNQWDLGSFKMTWKTREGLRYKDVSFNSVAREGHYIGKADELTVHSDDAEKAIVLTAHGFFGEWEKHGKRGSGELATLILTFSLQALSEKGKRHEGLKDMTTAQLATEVAGESGERRDQAKAWIWFRNGQAWASLLFALIGFPIGVIFRRAGRMVSFAISFAPLVFYYALMFGVPAMSRAADSWWPVLVPDAGLLVAAWLLMRKAFRQ